MKGRFGQTSAGSAAILVAIIGLLIVIYILMLQPAERAALLEGSGGGQGPGGQGGQGGFGGSGALLILAETPGTLQLQTSPVVEHSLPSTTVFTSTNTVAVKELSSLNTKNTLFSRQGASFFFDPEEIIADSFLLSFNVDYARGNLIILVNGEKIFDQEVTEKSPQPIIIPGDMIQEGDNEIVFLASEVGFRFWARNEYQLRNVLVSADALDLSATQSEQLFTIPEQEYSQLEFGELSFIPECDPRNAGRLIVDVNGRLIYSGYPDCGILNRLDLSKDTLKAGDNRLVFASDQGSYLLDRIEVTSHLKEQDYPVYYFNLPLDMYEPIEFGDAQLLLTLRFADYRAEKRGEVTINGFVQTFEADEYVYQAALDPNILLPGPNTIQIIPHVDELNVAELRIELV